MLRNMTDDLIGAMLLVSMYLIYKLPPLIKRETEEEKEE
jgi:hypothetical protein